MKLLATSFAVSALAACSLVPPRQANNTAHYDLGPQAQAAQFKPGVLSVGAVEVRSPSWLDSPAMHYRLAYSNLTRRETYVESRWIAPPDQLVEQALRRSVVSGSSAARGAGCTLRVDLDEFVHVFDQPAASFGVVEARAALLAPRTEMPLARHDFSLREPASSADARGGVAALSGAVDQLRLGIRDWLATIAGDQVQGSSIAQVCRGS